MSRNAREITPSDIDGMTDEQIRKLRNMRQSQLNHTIAVIDGKIHSIYRKNFTKLYAVAQRYREEIAMLDNARNDLSKVGTPMRIYAI